MPSEKQLFQEWFEGTAPTIWAAYYLQYMQTCNLESYRQGGTMVFTRDEIDEQVAKLSTLKGGE